MEVYKSEASIILKALEEWERTGALASADASRLKATIGTKQTVRQQIAQYFFFIALFCTILAFGAIFINEKLLERIKVYFSLNDLVIGLITAGLCASWFWYVGKKRKHISPSAYEIYMVLGGLAALTSLLYFCKDFGLDKTYTAFLSMSLPLLAVLSVMFRSLALWIGTLLTAVAWYGSLTAWQSYNNLFLGMNYPVRFTVFGMLVLAVSFGQRKVKHLIGFSRMTYTAGLIIFFTGMWGMSVFGNFNTLVGWQAVRQIHVLAYSVVFGAAAAASFYLGIKYKDELARDFGVLFLLINLYTRYFEYFWDAMNKGIFFLVLAVTFGVLGWWLERKRSSLAHEVPAGESAELTGNQR